MRLTRNAFALPRGWAGALGGRLMARVNRGVNAWLVELLEIGPRDRVLEIGCGPGVGISLAAARAIDGTVVGVDPSPVMLRQARERNETAVRRGIVELREAWAEHIPAAPATFTRVFSSNSVQFWPSIPEALREVRRVMVLDGRLVLGVRMRGRSRLPFAPSGGGWTEDDLATLVRAAEEAGFRVERVERLDGTWQQSAALVALLAPSTPK
jgi:SAM-dependent methyltransferase